MLECIKACCLSPGDILRMSPRLAMYMIVLSVENLPERRKTIVTFMFSNGNVRRFDTRSTLPYHVLRQENRRK